MQPTRAPRLARGTGGYSVDGDRCSRSEIRAVRPRGRKLKLMLKLALDWRPDPGANERQADFQATLKLALVQRRRRRALGRAPFRRYRSSPAVKFTWMGYACGGASGQGVGELRDPLDRL